MHKEYIKATSIFLSGVLFFGACGKQAPEEEEIVVEQKRETQQHSGVDRGLVEDLIHVDTRTAVLTGQPGNGLSLLLHPLTNHLSDVYGHTEPPSMLPLAPKWQLLLM